MVGLIAGEKVEKKGGVAETPFAAVAALDEAVAAELFIFSNSY